MGDHIKQQAVKQLDDTRMSQIRVKHRCLVKSQANPAMHLASQLLTVLTAIEAASKAL